MTIDIAEQAFNMGFHPWEVIRHVGSPKYLFPCGCFVEEYAPGPSWRNPDPAQHRSFGYCLDHSYQLEIVGIERDPDYFELARQRIEYTDAALKLTTLHLMGVI